MTIEEARATYKSPVNPRWVACHAALGRRPKAYEFLIWLPKYWRRFAGLHGCRDARSVELKMGVSEAHAAFDRWLEDEVAREVRG